MSLTGVVAEGHFSKHREEREFKVDVECDVPDRGLTKERAPPPEDLD